MHIIKNLELIYNYSTISAIFMIILICIVAVFIFINLIHQLSINQPIRMKILSICITLAMTVVSINLTDNVLQKYVDRHIKIKIKKDIK